MTRADTLSREDALRLRKLDQALQELKEGKRTYFSITRLSSIKSLCKDLRRRCDYCRYLAELVVNDTAGDAAEDAESGEGKHYSSRVKELQQEAYHAIAGLADGHQATARSILYKLMEVQSETRNVRGTVVRIVTSTELLVLENLLNALLSPPDQASVYVYHATRQYVERYNAHYGRGLIVDSIPMLEQVIGFWKRYQQ